MKSFFSHESHFKKILKEKEILLFLDYDGTLTRIVPDIQKAFFPKENKKILQALAQVLSWPVTILSGRALGDLKRMVGLPEVLCAGNHGLEMEGLGIHFDYPIGARFKARLQKIKTILLKNFADLKGIYVEDKVLTMSIHYRQAEEKLIPQILDICHQMVAPYLKKQQIKVLKGKKVFEIRPPVPWDKGQAILWLLKRYRFFEKGNTLVPVYVGDDTTDEDAFRVLKKRGISIRVGRSRSSAARYYLKDSNEVTDFLRWILKREREKK